MSSLPKPPPCGQNWLAMAPTAHGRHCSQCNKEIYDFSGMTWPEIEQTQAAYGNALCGMYAPAQLRHWGQQPPPACAPLAAATALALTLSHLTAVAQTPMASNTLTVSGTVAGITAEGKQEELPFASVFLVGTHLGTTADKNGRYELTIPADSLTTATIGYQTLSFKPAYFTLPPHSNGVLAHDALLTSDPTVIGFYVAQPSLSKRLGWRLRHLFSPRR